MTGFISKLDKRKFNSSKGYYYGDFTVFEVKMGLKS